MSDAHLDRRQFLGAVAGVALGAAALPDAVAAATRGTGLRAAALLDTPARESPIDTIVVVMLENRSFDHVLGWLGRDPAYLERGRRAHGKDFHVDARTDVSYLDPTGARVAASALVGAADEPNPWRGCDHPVPGHGWYSGRIQIASGFLAAGTGNDDYAIGYYERGDLPFQTQLVDRFTLCDRSFASVCAGTFPNRQYIHAAQAVSREDPVPLYAGVYDTPTIWDRLQTAQVSCGYYYTDLPVLLLWGEQYRPVISPLDRYFEQCADGTLPNVVMLDPGFSGDLRTDQHPQGDVRLADQWLAEVVGAFTRSPHWERGVLVVTHDEWGGFFDHVQPVLFDDPRANSDLNLSYGLGGFRVPPIVVSPYARRGYVDHRVYDHTSILRAIEWRFLGAPPAGAGQRGETWHLTVRDQHARNILGSLHAEPVDLDVDFLPTSVAASAACTVTVPPPDPVDAQEHDDPFVVRADLAELLARDYPPTRYTPWLDGAATR